MKARVDQFKNPFLQLLIQLMMIQSDQASLGFLKTDDPSKKMKNVSAAAKRLLRLVPESI